MRYSLVEQDLDGPASQGTAPPAPPPRADERRAPPELPDLRSAETDAVNRGHDPSIKYPRKPRSLPPPPLSGSGEPGPRTSLSTSTTLQPRDRVRNQRQHNPAPIPGANQYSASMRSRPSIRRARRAVRTVEQERARTRQRQEKRRDKRRARRSRLAPPNMALRLATQRVAGPGSRSAQQAPGTIRPTALSLLYVKLSANSGNYRYGGKLDRRI